MPELIPRRVALGRAHASPALEHPYIFVNLIQTALDTLVLEKIKACKGSTSMHISKHDREGPAFKGLSKG